MTNRSVFFWIVIVVLIIFLILLAGGCGLLYYRYKKIEEAVIEEVGNQTVAFYNEAREVGQENVKVKEEEKAMMDEKNWIVYQNEKYGYSFRYPSDWQVGSTEDDHVILLDNVNQVTFEFRSDVMVGFGLEGYDLVETKGVSVGGVDGEINYLTSPGGGNMIYVKFNRDGKDHLIAIYYPDDYKLAEELFDKIIKTASFRSWKAE